MRVAILSSLERTAEDEGRYCSALPVGDCTVLERQVEIAIAVGCERIACLADGLEKHILDAQHRAERAGAKFTTIRDLTALSGVVKSADTIVVMADGLVFPRMFAKDLAVSKNCVVSLPVEEAIANGFERIDGERAWAGVLLARGSLVEALSGLPDDFGVQSSLLRLALQDGNAIVPVDDALQKSGNLVLMRSSGDGQNWFRRQLVRALPLPDPYRPTTRLSDFLTRKLVANGEHLGSRATIMIAVWGLLLVAASALALWSYPLVGLSLLPLAVLAGSIGLNIVQVRFDDEILPNPLQYLTIFGPFLTDITFVIISALSVRPELMLSMGFASLILMGLHSLIRMLNPMPILRVCSDRAIVFAGLAIAGALGQIFVVTQLLAIIVLVALISSNRSPKLTAT